MTLSLSITTARARMALIAACVALVFALLADNAYAASPGPALSLDTCVGGFSQNAYTQKVVACVKTKLIVVTQAMMVGISTYMAPTVAIMFVYATLLMGIKIIAGERQLNAKTMGFLIRIGLVYMFAYSLGGYSALLYHIMDGLIDVASGGFNPFVMIDQFLGKLLGFGAAATLVQGLIGLITGALFSGTAGMALFLAGMTAIFNLLWCVFDIVFTYLSAVLLLSFMIVISPFIIPMAIFQFTERYFNKWLNTIVGAMLVPAMLFGFLKLTLGVFLVLILNIFAIFGDTEDPNFRSFYRINQPVFTWEMQTDPNMERLISDVTKIKNFVAQSNTNTNPSARTNYNASQVLLPMINFGSRHPQVAQEAVFAFVSLFLYAMVMKSLISKIPQVAMNIANMSISYAFESTSFGDKLADAKLNMQTGAGAMAGGVAGGELGGALSRSPIARQTGGIIGAITGGLIGRRL